MKIIIIRHGKVDYKWRQWSTSKEFNEDCRMYDQSPLKPVRYVAPQINVKNIYISTLRRSKDTAYQLYGDRDCTISELIDEVPMSASIAINKKCPLLFWYVSGRVGWFLNSQRQKESRKETILRADEFADIISKENENCAVITHGFFMHTLISVMKRKGFKIKKHSLHFKNGECVIAER